MAKIKSVTIGHGDVRFYKEVEPTPTTTRREGNVTINNMGQPGTPAYFEISYMLICNIEDGDLEHQNIFHWKTVIHEKDRNAPYFRVEDAAARKIAPMLRAVADEVEALVTAGDSNKTDETA